MLQNQARAVTLPRRLSEGAPEMRWHFSGSKTTQKLFCSSCRWEQAFSAECIGWSQGKQLDVDIEGRKWIERVEVRLWRTAGANGHDLVRNPKFSSTATLSGSNARHPERGERLMKSLTPPPQGSGFRTYFCRLPFFFPFFFFRIYFWDVFFSLSP